MKNRYAIGDIHGCLTALDCLLSEVKLKETDQAIFLGDYIDRGRDSKGVIDRIIELKKTNNVITLRGNHEIMMLEAQHDFRYLQMWLTYGGNEALNSYGIDDSTSWQSVIPNDHWEFLNSTLPFFETENHICVHANLDPETNIKDQSETYLYWKFCDDMKPHKSNKHIICGHTSQHDGVIKEMGFATCIDTFAVGGKWLTMLNIDTGQFWQSSENREFQDGKLITFSEFP